MPKKTNQDQVKDSKPKQQDMENQLAVAQNELAVMKELANLKDDSYYRLQMMSLTQSIANSLQVIAQASLPEPPQPEEEKESKE